MFPYGEDEMALLDHPAPNHVRLLRRAPRPESARLPHPSWRRALGGAPGVDGERLASAGEFWSRLGL